MTDRDQVESQAEGTEPKKISLAEAVKQKLAQKKQQQATGGKQKGFAQGGGPKLRDQNSGKKVTSHRKMGG